MAVSKERIEALFAEISKYRIELASDPTVLGAKYLQDLIATCRNYTNHVARIINELHKEKMSIDFDLKRKETAFKIAADDLLANDLSVRNLPNITDRQAQINILLRDEHREIEGLRNDISELEHLEKMVKLTHRELKDTMGEIKLQRSLIRDEIDTGRMYGDERPSARESAFISGGAARADDIDDEELAELLRGNSDVVETPNGPVIVASNVEPQTEAVEVEEVVQTEIQTKPLSEEEQVLDFLDKSNTSVPVPSTEVVHKGNSVVSDEDFSEIFDSI